MRLVSAALAAWSFWSFSVIVAPVPLAAQTSTPAPVAPPTLIQENVLEVTLDMVIRDKHGRALPNISKEEVSITEDGKPVKIQRLAQADASAKRVKVVTVLLDPDQPEWGFSAYKSIGELLKVAPPDVYFSGWRYDRQLEQVSALTRDRSAFDQSMRAVTVGLKKRDRKAALVAGNRSPAPDGTLPPSLALLNGGVAEAARKIAAERHVKPWMACISALSAQLGSVSGRKEILYFTTAVGDQGVSTEQLREIASEANRAGVSIYIVDVSGFSAWASAQATAAMTAGATEGAATAARNSSIANAATQRTVMVAPARSGQFDSVSAHSDSERNGAMRTLSAESGGAYFGESRDPREAMRTIAEDLDVYYEALYKPASVNYDGHFRTIGVHVKRTDAQVHTRSGYFAVPMAGGLQVAPFEIPLINALDGAVSGKPVAFESQVLHFERKENLTTMGLAVRVPIGQLSTREDAGEKLLKRHFAVLALIRTQDGQVLHKLSQDIPLESAISGADRSQTRVFTFQRHFALPAGDYWAEIAVADVNSGGVSITTLPVTVKVNASSFAVSDIALLATKAPGPKVKDPDDPLRYGDESITVQPGATLTKTSEGVLPIFLTLYPDPSTKIDPKLEITILRDGKEVGRFPVTKEPISSAHPQSFVASLPQHWLSTAHYTIVATASQGPLSFEKKREFDFVSDNSEEKDSLADTQPLLLTPMPKLLADQQKPSDAEVANIVSAAREQALDYQRGLPNFSCVEITRRYIDKTGKQAWKHQDSITEMLGYVSGNESYKTLEVNGEHSTKQRGDLGGVRTNGEFGQLLTAVFSEKAAASFVWQGKADVDGAVVYVFRYSVTQPHSLYRLTSEGANRSLQTAFDGVVYIDAESYAIRHVSIEALDIPNDFSCRESVVSVDYGYVYLGERKYLVPLSGLLRMRKGRRTLFRNEMQYRDYRRYTATSRLVG